MNKHYWAYVLAWLFWGVGFVHSQTIEANIKVNDGGNKTDETTIAINPLDANNLVAGSHYWTGEGLDIKHIAYYYSMNAGVDWEEGFLPLNENYAEHADPVVSFDADGDVYYSYISNDGDPFQGFYPDNGLFVNRSTDGGATWLSSPLVVVQNGDGTHTTFVQTRTEDKPWVRCDAWPESPYKNNVYIAWVRLSLSGNQIMVGRKQAGQGSFGDFQAVAGPNATAHGPQIAVSADGTVLVTWFEEGVIKVSESSDGGYTYSGTQVVATGVVTVQTVSGLRANSHPSIGIGNFDEDLHALVYIAWADKRGGNPDIYYVSGDYYFGGVTWSSPQILHAPSSADQWFPSVTVDPNGTGHIVYYDKRNHGVGQNMTDVYVTYLTPYDQWDFQVNTVSFDVTLGPGFFIGDYISIAASSTHSYPFWLDTRNGVKQDVYVGIIAHRTVDVTLDQVIDGQSSAMVDRWETDHFQGYAAGQNNIPMILNSAEIFRGLQSAVPTGGSSFEKYNRWNDLSDVRNHREFRIDFTPVYASNFQPTKSNVIIKNNLIDAATDPPNDNIQFRDPWFIDFNEPPYGMRNRGQNSAIFHTVASPFNPNTNPSGPGSEYEGVFLFQQPPNPLYEINALVTPLPGFTWYFLGWESDPAFATLGSPTTNETPVVFLQDGAVVSAKYKAHVASSSTNVTSPTTQRKIIRDADGRYHMVYESGDEIWYTRSTNGGATWTPEQRVSDGQSATGQIVYRTPSITVQKAATEHKVWIVWEEVEATYNHYVLSRSIDASSGTMGAEEWVNSYGSGGTPVIAHGNDASFPYPPYLLAVWYTGTSIEGSTRQPGGNWTTPTPLWYTSNLTYLTLSPICLSTSPSSALAIPLIEAPQDENPTPWDMAWVEGGVLKYKAIPVSGTLQLVTNPEVVATQLSNEVIRNPSIVNINGSADVSWEHQIGEVAKYTIRERRRSSGGSWSNPTIWAHTKVNYYTPTFTGYSGLNPAERATLAGRVKTNQQPDQLLYVQRDNGTWGSMTFPPGEGIGPMISVGWTNPGSEILLSRGSTSPYAIQQTAVTYGGSAMKPGRVTSSPLSATVTKEGRGGTIVLRGGRGSSCRVACQC